MGFNVKVLIVISLIAVIHSFSAIDASSVLVLNALDDAGLEGAFWLVESLALMGLSSSIIHTYVFHHKNSSLPGNYDVIMKNSNTTLVQYLETQPIPDRRLTKKFKHVEYVTKILYSWDYILSNRADSPLVLSLAFKNHSIPLPTPSFQKILTKSIADGSDLILLEKNRRLTSLSDWHDISVVVFSMKNSHFNTWYSTFKHIYKYYSQRDAFSSVDPRFAILEASTIHRSDIKIEYFLQSEVCSSTLPYEDIINLNTKAAIRKVGSLNKGAIVDILSEEHKKNKVNHEPNPYENSRCGHASFFSETETRIDDSSMMDQSPALEIHCGIPSHIKGGHHLSRAYSDDLQACLVLSPSVVWIQNTDHHIGEDISAIMGGSYDEISMNPLKFILKGIHRFRNTPNDTTTRPFCWENRLNTKEILPKARIEFNITASKLFTHPEYEKYRSSKSNISVVLHTASKSEAHSLDANKYFTISKMYYAKRHGYSFAYTSSNEFISYLPLDLFEDTIYANMKSDYFRGIMTKPLMMLDVMYQHLDKEWLLWTDDDVYFNPGWAYLPLDVYLSDIPADKVFVMANYRSVFTNAIVIRNNAQGRRLVIDWIIITLSGYIQCHGFDQAALAAVIAQRISRQSFETTKPLNYTCMYSNTEIYTGCNSNGDWSCDFKIENVLYKAGFKTKINYGFYGGRMSSFSKGCANDVVPEFHVITETELRPRFQAGLCTRLDEIESACQWDGPLGGGNMGLIPGKINGFFMNHKAEFLMYESYLRDNGCLYVGEVVPSCHINKHQDNQAATEEQHQKLKKRHLTALTDGYAFDYDIGTYCKITNSALLERQRMKTYMKHYEMIIKTLKKIPDEEWIGRYKNASEGEGRCNCYNTDCPYGANEDGQVKRRPIPWLGKDDDFELNEKFFERPNYCETCRKVKSKSLFGKHEYAVDCRTEAEEAKETRDRLDL